MSLFNLSSLSTSTTPPDEPQDSDHLSYKQFRSKLINQYAKSGVLKNLKTQLRTKILLDLKDKARDVQRDNYLREEDKENAFSPKSHHADTLKSQLFYAIILSFLKHQNLNYTISVLLSEADIPEHLLHSNGLQLLCEMLHREELPFKDSKKRLYTLKNAAEGKIDALEALYELTNQFLATNTITQSIQTEDQTHLQQTIDHKLRMLDEQFLTSRHQDQFASVQSLEERMIDFQRKCELRARKEVEEKMRFYEETSLSAMRLEESAKYREKLGVMKEKFEQEYSEKLKKLNERENETRELLRKKEQDFEKASYEHRQNMMKEVTKLQNKQNNLRRLELEVERARQDVADKARRIDVLHSQTSIDMKTELDVLRQQLESKYEQQMQELQVQRQMFEREKIQIQNEKQAMDNTFRAHGDVAMIKETAEQQRQTIESLKSQLGELRLENQHLKTICDELRHENNQFKYAASSGNPSVGGGIPSNVHASLDMRYNSLLKERQDLEEVNKVHVTKIQDLLRRNEILEKETTQLSHALDLERQTKQVKFEEQSRHLQEEVLREKNSLRQLTYKWNTERSLLRDQVEKLETNNESLQRELEEERLKMRKMTLDLSNEQALLKQTQQALENALSGDSSNELQTQADHRERLVRELQRELDQVKLEKQQSIRDLTSKLEEEARHAANLKEALSQNQKMLEKAQASFSNVTLSQEERDKQKRVEIQMLEDRHQAQITQLSNEKRRLESLVQQKEDEIAQLHRQLDDDRERFTQVEGKRRQLEDELTVARRQITDKDHDQQSQERINKEYEQRILDVKRDAEQRIRNLHMEIEMRFSSRVRELNHQHADALREAIGGTTSEMLQLLGNPQQLEESVRSQERIMGIAVQRPPVVQQQMMQHTAPATTTPITVAETRRSPREEIKRIPPPAEETRHVETVRQTQKEITPTGTTTVTAQRTTEVTSRHEDQPSTAPQQPTITTDVARTTTSTEQTSPPSPSPVASPAKEEPTGMQQYVEEIKKQRQDERDQKADSDDDFHITGFDDGLDDLGLERSDDEDLINALESDDDNDDFF